MGRRKEITAAAIWLHKNRPMIAEWLESRPTINGITYGPQWLELMEPWVGRWRQKYREGAGGDWLCERYLQIPIEKIKGEIEDVTKHRISEKTKHDDEIPQHPDIPQDEQGIN